MQDFPQPAGVRHGRPTQTGMVARQRQDAVARTAPVAQHLMAACCV